MRLRFWWFSFIFGIITPFLFGVFFNFYSFVYADTTSTSITVNATVSSGPAPVCGNSIVESGEACDDGNTTSGDGCSATCQLESVCGNRVVESGEQCDDGNTVGQDGCSATCLREAILGSSGNGPEISNVVASTTQTTAQVTFQAIDQNAIISGCVLDYGLTRNYTAEITASIRSGIIYESGVLANLTPSTDYFYRITCTDSAPNSGVYFGSFRTSESDTIAPVIANVFSNTTISTAEVNWTATDNVAVTQCTFVLDTYNRSNPQLLVPVTLPVTILSNNQYRINANGLYTHETYNFHITCVDDLPNVSIVNGSFTTQSDQTPPPDIVRPSATGQDSRNVLEWVYPVIPDSAFFMIRRSVVSSPLSITDGVLVTSTVYYNRNFLDEGLENGTTYYYTIFVFDTSGNHSNGVSVSATPRPAGDRDGDGVNDDMDACDGSRTGQIDTPSGTAVGANGCPFVTINVRNLTIYPVLLSSRTARDQFNRPMGAISFSGRSQIGGGLQPGIWFLDSPTYGNQFTVDAHGHITWPPAMDQIFSVTYGSGGSLIQILGIPLTIDTSRLDPRNQLRLYSPNLGTNFLPDHASLRLMPGQNYYFSHPYFATFFLSSSGLVIPGSGWENILQFANGIVTVMPEDICILPDTFVGSYRLVDMHGISAFSNQSSVYHILPSILPINSGFINSTRLISQATNQQSFFNFLTDPLRLSDPVDNETGSLINLTLNLQNIQAGIGQCGVATSRVCGNGRLELTEQCDDGNTRNGDGCSMQCNIEIPQPCGNGRLDANEQCDDGNTRNGDGCSAVCLREVAVCGNAMIEGNEQCDDGNTRNGDGCSAVCQVEIPVCGNGRTEIGEECDDGNTRNGDGCSAACQVEPLIPTECSDGIDNDGDGFVDMLDAGCSSSTDNSESQTVTVPIEPVPVSGPQPQFFIAQGTIQTELAGGFVTSLTGDQLTVFIPNTLVSSFATSLDFVLFGTTYHFNRDRLRSGYRVDVVVPPSGEYQALIIQNGLAQTVSILSFGVRSEPFGVVREAVTKRLVEQGTVQVSENYSNNIWNAGRYSQANPVYLGLGGNFGFVVPNNQYDISVNAPGFAFYSDSFSVSNHVLNPTIALLPSVRDILSMLIDDLLNGNFGDFLIRTRQLLEAISRAIQGALRDIGRVINDPRVQEANEQIVVPSLAAVSTIALLPSLSNIFLPLLRYTFFQPLLLLGKKKRREWGTVYNSFNKLPVDLAMVRLVDTVNKKVIQSRVTDLNGRYIFFADRGGYEIEVTKVGYRFPTTILGSVKEDGRFTDLYHGEHIPVQDEGAPVTPNVPIDPVGTEKSPRRIVWGQRARATQNFLSLSGIILTTISAIISPTIIVFGFLAGHVVLYVLFAKFIRPPMPKQWGTVYDAKTNKPIEKAIVRLFTKEYNKLISTQVTGSKGRYAFLAGPSAYYLSIQAPGHTEFLTAPIVPKNVERAFINQDVYIEKSGFDS